MTLRTVLRAVVIKVGMDQMKLHVYCDSLLLCFKGYAQDLCSYMQCTAIECLKITGITSLAQFNLKLCLHFCNAEYSCLNGDESIYSTVLK